MRLVSTSSSMEKIPPSSGIGTGDLKCVVLLAGGDVRGRTKGESRGDRGLIGDNFGDCLIIFFQLR